MSFPNSKTTPRRKEKARTWRRLHKWVGLVLTFFILAFALSGVFLNHRTAITRWDLPRRWLPQQYVYENWNNGAVVGTLRVGPDSVMLYGSNGIWVADTFCRGLRPCMNGMRPGTDNRNIRAVAATSDGQLFAISTYRLYRFDRTAYRWREVEGALTDDEALTDVLSVGDKLYVVTRSDVYAAAAPYTRFTAQPLPTPDDYDPRVSLFKTIWVTHSGDLFGLPGRLLIDVVGIIVVVLCLTGLVVTLFEIPIRLRKKRGDPALPLRRTWTFSFVWHNRLGSLFIVLLLLIVVTGMFLRPPLLIPIARTQVKPVPGSTLQSDNPWHDRLRRLRYDMEGRRWLLAASSGIYTFPAFGEQPKKLDNTPPVSVMGLNVWQQTGPNQWVVGSFSGIYGWDLSDGSVTDYDTGLPLDEMGGYGRRGGGGRPTFGNPVSGFSTDFAQGPVVFDYGRGVRLANYPDMPFEPMPEVFARDGRISFWHFCLELHVGRLYRSFLFAFTDFYIFLSGLLMFLVVLSGYIVYRRKYRRKKSRRKKRE